MDGFGERHTNDADKEGEEREDDDCEVLTAEIDAVDKALVDVLQLASRGGLGTDLGGARGAGTHERDESSVHGGGGRSN